MNTQQNEVYSHERVKQLMQENQDRAPLTAQDVRDARNKMHDAREAVQTAEANLLHAVPEWKAYHALGLQTAKQNFLDADTAFKDISQRGGQLESMERQAQIHAEQERKTLENQAATQALIESEAKADFQSRYIAAGGTVHSFAQVWPELWKQELMRRTFAGNDPILDKMRASGRYNI